MSVHRCVMGLRMKNSRMIYGIFPLLFIMAQSSFGQNPVADSTYAREMAEWQTRRLDALKRPQGWLALVALEWLKEGPNTLDSIGTLTLSKGVVRFQAFRGVRPKIGSKYFTSGRLKIEGGKEPADKVAIGTKVFTVIKRGDRFAVRMWDSTSPNLNNFSGIDRFPVQMRWKIYARWEAYEKPKMIKVASVIPGYVEEYPVAGAAVFTNYAREFRLEPVGPINEPLFFIFADRTNGQETYGGGRFLYADPPKDGIVILDFNKAINPPCAFTPFATCPLPPESNKLPFRVEAGEKNFGDH